MSHSAARARHLLDPRLCAALGFGSGLLRHGPGTAGTGVGIVIYLLLASLPGWVGYGATAIVVLLGVHLCGHAARQLQVHDDPAIVWDEIAGYLVTMLWLPVEWGWILAGFVVFRILDIAKPWPIGWVDRRMGGGLGIMIDDLLAGAAACAILHLARWFIG